MIREVAALLLLAGVAPGAIAQSDGIDAEPDTVIITRPAPSQALPATAPADIPDQRSAPAADVEFARRDQNHDGRLAGDELGAQPGVGDYIAVDRNGDGSISRGEFAAFESE